MHTAESKDLQNSMKYFFIHSTIYQSDTYFNVESHLVEHLCYNDFIRRDIFPFQRINDFTDFEPDQGWKQKFQGWKNDTCDDLNAKQTFFPRLVIAVDAKEDHDDDVDQGVTEQGHGDADF